MVVLGVAVDNPDQRMGAILALLDVGMIAYQNFRLGRVLLRVWCGGEPLELTPVGNDAAQGVSELLAHLRRISPYLRPIAWCRGARWGWSS
ncbi:MAG: hypothetical protein U1E86_28750 [Burkholderiaceae bacterium]